MKAIIKAIIFERFGGPDVLSVSQLPRPSAGPGEVLVKVAATTVNPTDIMMRNGAQAAMMAGLVPPYIAGMEFSGTLVDPGASGLEQNQPVIGVVNPRTSRGGAYAEIIAVSARSVAPISPKVDLVAAATVPMNALTAALALEFLALKRGQTLVVTGGAGLLGGFAIQLAKVDGLTVLANVGERDRTLVGSLGADHLLTRNAGLEAALRAICPDGVDGMIDGALIGQQLAHLVRDGGGIVSLRSSYKISAPRARVHNVSVLAGMQDTAKLKRIADLVGSGRLLPRAAEGGRYSYRNAAAAHAAAEARGLRGRIVITFED